MIGRSLHKTRSMALLRCSFSSTGPSKNGKEDIINMRKVMHVPTKRLDFAPDGRFHLTAQFLTKLILYSKTVVPFGIIMHLIKINPLPVLLPVMFILEVWLLKRMWNQKVRLRNTISEIYLHKNGEEIEIVYMNRFFCERLLTQRKLKKESPSRFFLTPTFQFTDDPEDLEYKVLSGEHFPRSLPLSRVIFNWAWIRYFHNNTEYFYIPKDSKYINEEVLVAALNGKLIDTSQRNIRDVKHHAYPPVKSSTSHTPNS